MSFFARAANRPGRLCISEPIVDIQYRLGIAIIKLQQQGSRAAHCIKLQLQVYFAVVLQQECPPLQASMINMILCENDVQMIVAFCNLIQATHTATYKATLVG